MKTSAAGRAAIEQREGRRLTAYQDSRGIWTIGVGHAATGLPPRPHAGMTITETECDALLAADLAPVEAVINTGVKVPLTQNEFDALTSLGFNIGVGGLRGSTVVKKLNGGDVQGAADALMNWCKPAILTSRREAERKQFLTPDLPDGTGLSRSQAVAAARASLLADRAAKAKARSNMTAAGGATIGIAATATATAAGHHRVVWIVAAVVLVGAAIDAIVTLAHRRSAGALSANALAQASAAARLNPPTPAQPVKS